MHLSSNLRLFIAINSRIVVACINNREWHDELNVFWFPTRNCRPVLSFNIERRPRCEHFCWSFWISNKQNCHKTLFYKLRYSHTRMTASEWCKIIHHQVIMPILWHTKRSQRECLEAESIKWFLSARKTYKMYSLKCHYRRNNGQAHFSPHVNCGGNEFYKYGIISNMSENLLKMFTFRM